MNAKRKWDMRTILLVLIISVIILAAIYVFLAPPGENASQSVLTVEELVQNSDSYVEKRITVEGFYYISLDGPCLVPATTVSDPNPDIKINLDKTSFNLAKQVAGNITVSSNLKYRVVGVLQKIPLPFGFDVKIMVESIKAV